MERKQLTEMQLNAVVEFAKQPYTSEAAEILIEEFDLPFDNTETFRKWIRNNLYDDLPVRESKTATPSLRNLTKFSGEESIKRAELLLDDREKAIAGTISALEEDIVQMNTLAEQEIAKIKVALEEKIAPMNEYIEKLRAELKDR